MTESLAARGTRALVRFVLLLLYAISGLVLLILRPLRWRKRAPAWQAPRKARAPERDARRMT